VAGRRAEAVAAFAAAVALAPQDAGLMSRLAAARLAGGDVAGTMSAAGDALRLDPQSPGVREMLAFAALFRGDVAGVGYELDQLSPAARRGEAAGLLAGTTRLMRMELPQARTAFAAVLLEHPNSIAGRLWLARVARMQGQPVEAEQLLGEALRAAPGNIEAAGMLAAAALPGQPRAAEARAILQAAQAAAPAQFSLAQTMANLHIRAGEAAMAVRILAARCWRRSM
jgi:predicted Zn-dependent protease